MMDNINDILNQMKMTIEPLLCNGVMIHHLAWRPYDMGVFGGEGFSFVLCKPPNKILGATFKNGPSKIRIANEVKKIQKLLEELDI